LRYHESIRRTERTEGGEGSVPRLGEEENGVVIVQYLQGKYP